MGLKERKLKFFNKKAVSFLGALILVFAFTLAFAQSFNSSARGLFWKDACAADGKVVCFTTTTKAYPVDANGIPAIPLYKQGRSNPWSDMYYGCGGTTVASSGCGPTSLAMVLSYFTRSKIYPDDTAAKCLEISGCRVCNAGTSVDGLATIARGYNMDVSIDIGWSAVVNLLDQKKPVIITVGPNDGPNIFTDGGHYIVLKGKIGNTVYINDSARDNTAVDVGLVKNAYDNGSQHSLYVRAKDYK